MSSINTCPKCSSTDIDTDGARGEAVCTNCGHVLEECVIVSEVQFSESAGGQSSVVGQFVPENGLSSFHSGPGYGGFSKDSREVTLSNGRRVIQHMAGLLRLVSHHVDVAQRFFQQAVQRNFIQGRKTHTVVAVCLYIVCRKQKTSHMLIDFAEVLQMDVYELGSVFLKFTKLLHIKLDPIDPSLYIHRFASMLEYGDKTQQVSLTALRIVARMNRDWMITGRRPAGICGAGLLIASKMHNFKRTEAQIAQVVRICDGTLRKRLNEFDDTSVSQLTVPYPTNQPACLRYFSQKAFLKDHLIAYTLVEQFHEMFKAGSSADAAEGFRQAEAGWQFDLECAPPALKNNLEKERKLELARKRKAGETVEEDDLVPDWSAPSGGIKAGKDSKADLRDRVREAVLALGGGQLQELETDVADPNAQGVAEQLSKVERRAAKKREKREMAARDAESAAAKGNGDDEGQKCAAQEEDDDLSDVDDDEIDSYIRTEEEASHREVVWNEINRDYIEIQAEKARQAEFNLANGITAPVVKRKRKASDPAGPAKTAAEATARMLKTKNLSNKVNYSALQELFGEDGDDDLSISVGGSGGSAVDEA